MCSVIGVYSKKGRDVSHEAHKLISCLAHRGPHAFGVKTPGGEKKSKGVKGLLPLPKSPVILGHCLLSTTGYGIQPLTSKGVSIAHNGQIYNYAELNPSGEKLVSDSDAIARFLGNEIEKNSSVGFEGAVRAFFERAEGEYSVGALRGANLYAFRDVLGIKPLWFGENDSIAAFASEPSALMKLGIQFPQPLMPGHLLEISQAGVSSRKIFSLDNFRETIPSAHSPEALKKEFERAMDLQCAGIKKAAVLFSGGVDSSLIAKAVSERVPKTTLFVAGAKGSGDMVSAEHAAKALGLPLEKIPLSGKNVQGLAFHSMKILSFFDEMQAGLALPILACAEAIRQNGFSVVFSGQGSDELFAGYSSYANSLKENGYAAVEEEIWAALSRMWSRNFYRDDAIIASQSLELRVPFMALGFIREAMAFPAQEKIFSPSDNVRKHPLRNLARASGIPEFICAKPKKALQYGSGSQRMVSKLLRGLAFKP